MEQSTWDDPNSMTKTERDRLNSLIDPYSLNTISTRILCSDTINRGALEEANDPIDQDEEFYQGLRNKIRKSSLIGSKENFRYTGTWRNISSAMKRRNAFYKKHDDIIKRFKSDMKHKNPTNYPSTAISNQQFEFDLNIPKQPQSMNQSIDTQKESFIDPRQVKEVDNIAGNTNKQGCIFDSEVAEEAIVEVDYEAMEFCDICYEAPSSNSSCNDSLPFCSLPDYSLTSPAFSQSPDN